MPPEPLVIVNPAAGAGRAARLLPWIRERLAGSSAARLHVTTRPGDAEEAAAAARGGAFGRVVAVGGDGTIQEVVNGVLAGGEAPELGIVPVGTGNDLARSLGLPRGLAAAWSTALGADSRPIDVARATNGDGRERWFTSAGGIGFDAQVAAAMATRRGWRASRAGYLLTTLAELRRFDNRRVRMLIDGQPLEQQVLLVAIANGEYYGGGMRIAPGARADDGRLEVCVVGDVSRLTALGQLANLYRGTHVNHPAVTMYRAATLSIEGDAATRVHLDGEPFGTLPLRVALSAGCLRVAAAG